MQVLVPDCRGVDQRFHDVTIVDMGGIVCVHSGVIGVKSAMAPGGHQPHGVASEGTGRDAVGG